MSCFCLPLLLCKCTHITHTHTTERETHTDAQTHRYTDIHTKHARTGHTHTHTQHTHAHTHTHTHTKHNTTFLLYMPVRNFHPVRGKAAKGPAHARLHIGLVSLIGLVILHIGSGLGQTSSRQAPACLLGHTYSSTRTHI
jgi:hypothetical protein